MLLNSFRLSSSTKKRREELHLRAVFSGQAQHDLQAALHVIVGGSPGGDAGAHGRLPLPDGAAAPAGPVRLDGGVMRSVVCGSPKLNQHLVEHDVVEHPIAGLAEVQRVLDALEQGQMTRVDLNETLFTNTLIAGI